MSSYTTNKANGLYELRSSGLPVPEFTIIRRGENYDHQIPEPLIVRSCLFDEDGSESSKAGQGQSVGPILRAELNQIVQRLFQDSRVAEVIVQHFIDAPSGVLFSLGNDGAYFEYGREARCVTDGKAVPFCATFPNDISKYDKLKNYLEILLRRFSNFNAELTFGESISFLQIRPATSPLSIDLETAQIKMTLQEIDFESITQTEFCHDVLESPNKDLSLIRALCDTLPGIFKELGINVPLLRENDFLKIGNQIFMKDQIPTLDLSSRRLVSTLAQWALRECFSKHCDLAKSESLMRRAFALRALCELPGPTQLRPIRRLLLKSRFKCREDLLNSVEKNSLDPVVHSDRLLKSPIVKSGKKLIWEKFEYETELGEVIVEGNFDEGPFAVWPIEPAVLGDRKVTLLCEELYPAIGKHFDNIKGVICRRGAITSHLAILAREEKMPLWIRVPEPEIAKRMNIRDKSTTSDPQLVFALKADSAHSRTE